MLIYYIMYFDMRLFIFFLLYYICGVININVLEIWEAANYYIYL